MSFYITNNRPPKKQKDYAFIDVSSFDVSQIIKEMSSLDISHLEVVELRISGISKDLLFSLSTFIEDNEISIGLIVNNYSFISDNEELLSLFNVYICRPHLNLRFMDVCAVKEAPVQTKVAKHPDALLIDKAEPACTNIKKRTRMTRVIKDLDESFKDKLFRYLNKCKKTNVQVYTDGGITRKLFSKVISPDDYIPKKATIMCLIIGMELCLDDALDLLGAAGYTLSNSIRTDKIIKTSIIIGNYNIDDINIELDRYGETVLGWRPRED